MPKNDDNTAAPSVDVPQLVRLPNGAWVRPNAVTAIRLLMTEKGSLGDLHRARVAVHHGGFHEILLANDNDHAQAMADELESSYTGHLRAFMRFSVRVPCFTTLPPEELARLYVESKARHWSVASVNQFRNALVFYYRHVIEKPLSDLGQGHLGSGADLGRESARHGAFAAAFVRHGDADVGNADSGTPGGHGT